MTPWRKFSLPSGGPTHGHLVVKIFEIFSSKSLFDKEKKFFRMKFYFFGRNFSGPLLEKFSTFFDLGPKKNFGEKFRKKKFFIGKKILIVPNMLGQLAT